MELKIRVLTPEDIPRLKEIHQEFFNEEFEFPDFHNNKYICAFVVTDENNNIISGGGVRYTIEATILTDKNFSVKDRQSALYQVLQSCEYVARQSGFNTLHAITENETWRNQLLKVGFHSRGNCLAINV